MITVYLTEEFRSINLTGDVCLIFTKLERLQINRETTFNKLWNERFDFWILLKLGFLWKFICDKLAFH